MHMNDSTPVLYRKGETHIRATVVDGKTCAYSGDPIQPFLDDGYELMPMGEAWPLVEAAQVAKYVGEWIETTREDYWEHLECLPPEAWYRGEHFESFRMCEYMTGNITAHYVQIGDRYFTANRQTTLKPAELEEQVRAFIKEHPESTLEGSPCES